MRHKLEMLIKNTKYSEVENKIQDMNGLVITTFHNTKTGEVEKKTPDFSVLVKKKIITLQENLLLLLTIINLRVIYLIQR